MHRRDFLVRLLSDHTPVDAMESSHSDRLGGLLRETSDAFSRKQFAPGHVTASAFVLSPDRGSLLLIHHRKLQRWLQPGGHVEPTDSDVVAASLREVAEETGLVDVQVVEPGRPLFDVDVHRIPPHKGEPAHEHFDVRVLLQAGTLAACAGSDASDHRWVPLDEVYLLASDPSVLRAVGKLARLS